MNQLLYKELSVKVLGMAFTVHNILGPGLLEHCCQEACCVELHRMGIAVKREKIFALYYKGECIGGYKADLAVDNKSILELKSVKEFSPAMEAQTINYLRLSKIPVGYLINLNGVRVNWKRFAC